MKFRKRFIILPIALSLAVSGYHIHQADARKITVGISPPILEIIAQPGAQIREKITISGQTDDFIQLSTQTFQPEGEFGQITIPEDTGDPATNWISFSEKNFVLPSTSEHSTQTSKQIILSIDIPEDASSADHYLVILAANHGESIAEGPQAATSYQVAKIGLNLLLTVVGEENLVARAHVVEFSTPRLHFETPFEFIGRIQNTGQTRFKTQGHITLKDIFGRQVAREKLVPLNVLKRSIRCLQTSPKEPGFLRLEIEDQSLVSFLTRNLPNLFTATLEVRPETLNIPAIAKRRFLYLPKNFLIAFLTTISLTSIIIIVERKKKTKSSKSGS